MAKIEAVVKKLRASGVGKFYLGTQSDPKAISDWESREKVCLPADYRYFQETVGACKMHGAAPEKECSFSVKLFSLQDVRKLSAACEDLECDEAQSWYVIADAQDGNYILMDLASVKGNRVDIIDGFIEMIPEVPVISRSFTEFLERSLKDPDTSSGGGDTEKGSRYWSTPGGYYGEANER